MEMRYPGRFPVFFVGASAGGVQALKYLAQQLPADFPAPVFMLLHRRRDADKSADLFPGILRAVSNMPIVKPAQGEVIKSSRIYVAHGDRHLGVEDNRAVLFDKPDNETWRPGIDVLFKCGAREYKDRAVTVLLTGDLDDGVAGLIETTVQGGVSVAQAPDDAYNPVLPLNAVMQDHPDYVLPLADMPALFCELAQHPCADRQTQITEEAALAAVREKQATA